MPAQTRTTKTTSKTTGKTSRKTTGKIPNKAKTAKTTNTESSAKAADKDFPKKIIVRQSRIHGRGVYAGQNIKKGERIVEYIGQIISWKEADRRPPSDPNDPNHTFFFSLSNGKQVIDGSVNGNDARWINHSCDPNCETEEDEGRVFVEAIRDIKRGEELLYDYCLIIDERITPTLKKQYQCLCGAKDCRGTMLALKKRKKAA